MLSKRRILLVDDNPNASYILTMILKLNDYDVIPYGDPCQALSDFGEGLYDLLMLVVEMASMNGFELYQNMKEIDRNIKVCFMTNHRQRYLPVFNRLFPELSSRSLVNKPVSADDVLEILRQHLGG